MQALQRRVRRVPAEDLQQLELDCEMGGILHEEVSLQAGSLEGDVLHAGTVTAQVKLSREAVLAAEAMRDTAPLRAPLPQSLNTAVALRDRSVAPAAAAATLMAAP